MLRRERRRPSGGSVPDRQLEPVREMRRHRRPNIAQPQKRDPCHAAKIRLAALTTTLILAACQNANTRSIDVPEDRSQPKGRHIALHVVILPARSSPVAPDPIVFLDGGPGLAATEDAAYASWALAAAHAHHDIVLVDQRGTGQSNPLDCHLYDDGSLQSFVVPIFPPDRVRTCRTRLSPHADLTHYTTTDAADDLDQVLTTLGYHTADLFGASYGTNAALTFTRLHPDRVRRLILLGVYPPDHVAGLAFGRAGAEALRREVQWCAADRACREAAPDPLADLDTAMAQLRHHAVTVRLWNWRQLREEPVTLTARGFNERAFSLFYSPSRGRRLFPLLRHALANDDWTDLVSMLVWQGRMQRAGRSTGMTLSVLCSEDSPRLAAAAASGDTTRLAAASPFGLPVVAELLTACADWPRRSLDADDTMPVVSDVPTLLISGALDPVTPPDWAADAAAHLPNSVQLIDSAAGHAMLNDEERAEISAFIAARTAPLHSQTTSSLSSPPPTRSKHPASAR
jgi:pimeloyl-ACP methyl ester carboxylesterase